MKLGGRFDCVRQGAIKLLAAFVLAFALSACGTSPPSPYQRDYFPGGAPFYSAGSAQDKEYFLANVKRAQYNYALYSKERLWVDSGITPAPATLNMLQAYYSLSVRWELKDGRQFIAENIDVSALMREYFKNRDIKLPWQREGRARSKTGDIDPALVFEVKNDEVTIKWLITTNLTPVHERLTATGAATRWTFSEEQYPVAAVKGTPTSGIDFNRQWELRK